MQMVVGAKWKKSFTNSTTPTIQRIPLRQFTFKSDSGYADLSLNYK